MGGTEIERAMAEGVRAERLRRESLRTKLQAEAVRSEARAIRSERAPLWIEWWPHRVTWRSGPSGDAS